MFVRSFLVVFGIVIIASIATANDFPQAFRILQSVYVWANGICLHRAAIMCQAFWNDQQRLIWCGGQWLQPNKRQCMVG